MTDRYVVRTEHTAAQRIAGEAVVINFETYYYYALNRTGTAVWDLLQDGARDRDEIAAALGTAFGRAAADVAADVNALIDTLLAEGLIEPGTRGSSGDTRIKPAGAYVAPSLEKHERLDQLILSGE